jgi:hypothetical protein
LQAALACALFVLIKQVAIVLLALLAGAFLIAAAKNKILGPALRYLPPLLIPALILHGLWQYDVDTQMANGGFGIKPLAAWRFDLAGSILGAIAHEMMRKSGLFILLVALIGTGTVALFRKPSRVGTFALIAAPVCGGYLIFLFVSYLGSNFVDAEATRAASFYRYATHLGLLGIAFVWLAVPEIGRRIKVKMPALPFDPAQAARIGTVSLLLLPLALAINGAWLVPKPGAEVCAVRALGHKIAAALPADVHHLAVLDPEGQGLARYIVNLELELAGAQTGRVILADRGADHLDAAALAAQLQEAQSTPNTDAILILRSSTPELLLREGMVWKTRTF